MVNRGHRAREKRLLRMATKSHIEWTQYTWNPLTGCNKISPGCKNCYADRMAKRLQAMGVPKYRNGFGLTLHESALNEPLTWRTPRIVFVNSMSDLFHEHVPTEFIVRVLDVIRQVPQHKFQILTKRSWRLMELNDTLDWPSNAWIGVSVENKDYVHRIDHLRVISSAVRFLSLEPLLGPLRRLNLDSIDWVIVGGESGPNCRPVEEEWVRDIRDQCVASGVPFFFKQWGGVHRSRNRRMLDGYVWDEMPASQLVELQ